MFRGKITWKITVLQVFNLIFVPLLYLQIDETGGAQPIDIVTEKIKGKIKPLRKIHMYIPRKEPIISRRQREYYDWGHYDWGRYDWGYYDKNGYPLKYVTGHWVDDDYMPFLGAEKKLRSSPIEVGLYKGQIIPILKSMVLGTGIKQGPKEHVRVAKTDLYLTTLMPVYKLWEKKYNNQV